MTTNPSVSLFSPRILVPFLIITVIWGATWIVIKGQLGVVPPSWSVTYRFLVAGIVMLGVALATRVPVRVSRGELLFAAALGVAQFVFNFNFVYRAEYYVTSGLVAVVFALLFVPNALLSRVFLGQAISTRFLIGSLLSVAGIAILFVNEAAGDNRDTTSTLMGIVLTLAGVGSASIANVMQATQRARAMPMATLLAWAMLFGTAVNAIFAWVTVGPPVIDMRPAYFFGIAYLGIIGSAVAFSVYFGMIRMIGPAKAAYSSVTVPIVAMLISTIVEDYRWSGLAICGSVLALAGLCIALSPARKLG